MGIASAVENNGNVYLYNEKGGTIAAIPVGNGPRDGLQGYTATSVSIRRGAHIYVYNEQGSLVRSIASN